MGLFDSVYAACPACGKAVELQSKEGECYMHVYTRATAPAEVLIDVLNDPHYCRDCGCWMALVDPAYPPGRRPRPTNVRAVRLREPSADEVKIHSSQPSLRWWEAPFTYDDIIPEDRPTCDSGSGPEGEKPQALSAEGIAERRHRR